MKLGGMRTSSRGPIGSQLDSEAILRGNLKLMSDDAGPAETARRGEARRGEARRGEARRGEARRGEADFGAEMDPRLALKSWRTGSYLKPRARMLLRLSFDSCTGRYAA